MRHFLPYLLPYFLFIFLSSFQTPTAFSLKLGHQCLHNERSALLQLQLESMNINSTRLGFWEPDTDCCHWKGVTCNTTSGHVIGLDLSSMLTTRINSSSSLFRLHSLQRLNLAQNDFKFSPIPSGLDRFANLTHLNLSQSCFSGQIPLEISRLTRLVSLDLSINFDEFDRETCFFKNMAFGKEVNWPKLEKPNLKMLVQNLTSLRELYLDCVDISAQNSDWGQAIAYALPNLSVLSLSNCRLSGPIHSSLSQLRFLSVLRFDGNNLSIVAPSFLGNLSHLEALNLTSCGLYGKFPENVFQLPNLQTLDVSDNLVLTGYLPDFPPKNAFRVLSLHDTNFSGGIPKSIGNLKFLTKLQLSRCNFSGPIPSSLASLTKLVELDLSFNSFNGTINSSLFTLPLLQYLNLYNNQLSGQLNEFSIASFSSLELVDLGRNELKGQIPKSIGELSRLRCLSFDSNKFNGTVKFEMFQNLKNLSLLHLSNNTFSVKIGKKSFKFPQFEKLYLGSCHINEFPNFLKHQEKLRFLDLSNNQLHGHVPNWIWKKTLEYLVLSNNEVTNLEEPLPNHSNSSNLFNYDNSILNLFGLYCRSCNLRKIPDFLKDQNMLQELDLSNNNIHGQIPNWIWENNLRYLNLSCNSLNALERPLLNFSSVSLFTLDLHSNMLQGSIPVPSPSISFFFISNNKFIGDIPDLICKLSGLKVFDASHNNLSGLIPECLGNIDTLSVLNLQGNGFHRMPQNFTSSCNLRTININENQIKGKVPRSFANCTLLEILDLGGNKISGTFPYWLETLPFLQVLVLRSNKFCGPIKRPRTNNVFPMLHVMDLSSNGFTDNLPTEYFHSLKAMMSIDKDRSQQPIYIGGGYYNFSVIIMSKGQEMVLVKILKIFTSLDLSNNKFQGKILEAIGDLKSLIVLNLSRNDLTGQISSSIGNLLQLESLDLSQNKLSGEIPLQLARLTFLEIMNLSQNHLKGSIPQGYQFNTFSSTSYEGNPGLCGFPLSRKCRDANDDIQPQDVDTPLEDEGSQSLSRIDWKLVLMGYGCGMIILIVTRFIIF